MTLALAVLAINTTLAWAQADNDTNQSDPTAMAIVPVQADPVAVGPAIMAPVKPQAMAAQPVKPESTSTWGPARSSTASLLAPPFASPLLLDVLDSANTTSAADATTLPTVHVNSQLDQARDYIAPSPGALPHLPDRRRTRLKPCRGARMLRFSRSCCGRRAWLKIPLDKCMCAASMPT